MSGASTVEPVVEPVGAALAAWPLARVRPILVIGLGNPLLGDDGVGWRVAAAVEPVLAHRDDVAVDYLAIGGLSLMERLVGCSTAVIVDAVVTGADPPGTVRCHDLATVPVRDAGHLDSAHDVTLAGAIEAGRLLGATLPEDVAIVTIEAARVHEFTERLTPAVAAAVPVAAERVMELLAGRPVAGPG